MEIERLPEGLGASGATRIAEELKSISGGIVLDVATGDGGFVDTLMKALKDYSSFVGIDNSKKEVEAAKKRLKGQPVEMIEMDAEALGFESGSFDTVCISYSLHHLHHIHEVLAEMKRVLKPNGYFIVQEEFSDGEQTEAQKTGILQHHWHAEIDTSLGTTHNKTFSKQKIKSIINDLELRNAEIFESTHLVKCIFCDEKFECENPRAENIITESIEEIDIALKRLENHSDSKWRICLEEEGKRLKERIMIFGVSSASHLLIVGRK